MLDLRAQSQELKYEIENALKEILESGHFVLGEHVKNLEQEVAAYHNVKHAVSLASGTDSLHLCLKALGIKEGDEVITTPFTFIATAEAITYVGATPVFADIDKHTLNIDPLSIKEKITSKTRAIIPVHLFGYPADMQEIMNIAQQNNLGVIEDSAQAFGAKHRGKAVGSIGDTGCFSFYPSKNLGGYGDGGIMVTKSKEIYEKVMLYRNHGTTGPYKHSFIGYNSRLDEMQAAIIRIKLKKIDEYNQKRRDLAEIYTSILSKTGGVIQCPPESPDMYHVYHQYTVRVPRREEIQRVLKEHSISSVVYYPLPLHLQEAFKNLGYGEGDFPVCEAVAKDVLSLPMYPELDPGAARYVAETVVKAVS
ncbi:DegT/DnrJ/EryC1/StrS family aminotransferase [bacterium]|nr:MAG: DegT/DnrJ/EryC1/StrS family aminotransferase [bacterium]